jgi:hypothetical protein
MTPVQCSLAGAGLHTGMLQLLLGLKCMLHKRQTPSQGMASASAVGLCAASRIATLPQSSVPAAAAAAAAAAIVVAVPQVGLLTSVQNITWHHLQHPHQCQYLPLHQQQHQQLLVPEQHHDFAISKQH